MKKSSAADDDYYQTLGVDKNADDNAIKKAYKKLALKWHPDRNKGNEDAAAEQFKKVGEAYSVLSNPEKRTIYDKYGKAGLDPSAGPQRNSDFGGFGGFPQGGGFTFKTSSGGRGGGFSF